MYIYLRQLADKIMPIDMSYIRGSCGVSGWDGASNERVYEQFGMGMTGKGVE